SNSAPSFRHFNMTYRQLNEQSDRLAGFLSEKGVLADNIVAIMVEPSVEVAIGILSILKAGGAYMPIEPDYPQERIDYMLKDSGAEIIMNHDFLVRAPQAPFHHSAFILNGRPCRGLHHSNQPAYIIYTSGSTGQPKGVLVEHRGLVNYTCWRINTYRLIEKDVTLELLSYTFDGFGSNFYSSLLSGGTLILIPNSKKLDYQYIRDIVRQEGVTNISLVPGMYDVLVDVVEAEDFRSLRFVVLAGERAGKTLLDKSFMKNPGILHINEYGPTEATVTAVARVRDG
ncbi:MAG: hypothetical protein QG657_1133, partial [Acidobacteriota bacterium]|nr:hypothetical protein [Acidobacteriota bacterium]